MKLQKRTFYFIIIYHQSPITMGEKTLSQKRPLVDPPTTTPLDIITQTPSAIDDVVTFGRSSPSQCTGPEMWVQGWLRSVQRRKKMVGLLTRSTDLDLKRWHFWIGSADLEEEGDSNPTIQHHTCHLCI